MATLTVWKFDSVDGAGEAVRTLRRLQQQQQVQVQDAAIVSWPENAKKPSIAELHDLVATGLLGGAFWGALFALMFLVPVLGLAIAAGISPLVATTADIGIDDALIKSLRDKIVPGTSAVLLMTVSAVTDRALDEVSGLPGQPELIESNLTRDQEAKLRRIFAEKLPTSTGAESPSIDSQARSAA